ncbi:MAG: HPr family phosphocarrier protein, partial [Acetatifactor sp.]|nr:HPr family phosphocarrier protein [Acetatifactor sp.]
MTKRNIQVRLENGLEARPVALLVQEASKYESTIYIQSG